MPSSGENKAHRVGQIVKIRPNWKDPRLGIGIILLALAVAMGSWLVSFLDARTTVWAARGTLTPGTALAGHVREVRVHPDVARYYLPATRKPQGVVTRTVGDGELIATSAIGQGVDVQRRSVVIPLGAQLPEHATRGTLVDIWLVPTVSGSESTTARILAEGAIIEQVHQASAVMTRQFGTVEVGVSPEDVAALLAGMGSQGFLAVIPQADQ